jgi:hypothetical protein
MWLCDRARMRASFQGGRSPRPGVSTYFTLAIRQHTASLALPLDLREN